MIHAILISVRLFVREAEGVCDYRIGKHDVLFIKICFSNEHPHLIGLMLVWFNPTIHTAHEYNQY